METNFTSVVLKIDIVAINTTKTLKLSKKMSVREVCRIVWEVPGAARGEFEQSGLLKSENGVWFDMSKSLEELHLQDGDCLEYRSKMRLIRVRTLEDSIRIISVDDSHTVLEVTKTVCERIGLSNSDEYSFTLDDGKRDGDSPLKRKPHYQERVWLEPERTLREQGVTETMEITLRKKYFFSDGRVDITDLVQLNLIYVQSRNTILDGTLPCTKDEAIQLAALQCYIQYGKITSLDNFPIVCGFLPHGYFEIPHAQHAIWNEYEKLQRFTESEAKFAYIQLCRSLPTYGITIFHVKERSKIKLVPILLGISKDTIMTLDLKAKCVVNSWPLNTVHSWAQTSNTFSLKLGEDLGYSVVAFKTDRSKEISSLLQTYLKIHATQNQKLCSGKTLGAVMVPSDQKEKIYTPLIRSSANTSKGYHLDKGLVMTPSDQDKRLYTEPCRSVIPSSGNPMRNEAPAEESKSEYALPSSVYPITQSSHSVNKGIGSTIAPVLGKCSSSQMRCYYGSSLMTPKEGHTSGSDQTAPIIQPTLSDHVTYYNDSSLITSSRGCNSGYCQTGHGSTGCTPDEYDYI